MENKETEMDPSDLSNNSRVVYDLKHIEKPYNNTNFIKKLKKIGRNLKNAILRMIRE
jgi:hypothetical protein